MYSFAVRMWDLSTVATVKEPPLITMATTPSCTNPVQ